MYVCVYTVCTEVVVVHAAEVESVPAITVTSDELAAEEKNKGVYEQLKELLVSDKQQQQQVRVTSSRSQCANC